jgi:hypothetical protein
VARRAEERKAKAGRRRSRRSRSIGTEEVEEVEVMKSEVNILGTLKKASAAAFQGTCTGSDPL